MVSKLLFITLSPFPIKDKPLFSNGPKSLPRNPPDCAIFDNWVFDNFLLADEPFAKTWQSFVTSVLVKIN